MIISHKYKFIFVKTRKTAGTSMEVTLSKYCGPDDVLTEINPPEEGHEPRNFWIDKDAGLKFYNHMPASEIKAQVGDEIWKSYFKFCYERHPYVKSISLFHMHRHHFQGDKSGFTFDKWLHPKNVPVDFFMYTDGAGAPMVDQIFRYKSLSETFPAICKTLGIPCTGLESRAKSAYEKVPVELSDANKAYLQQAYAAEFQAFGFPK